MNTSRAKRTLVALILAVAMIWVSQYPVVHAVSSLVAPAGFSVETFLGTTSPQLAGLLFDPVSGDLLVADKGSAYNCVDTPDGAVLRVSPSGAASVYVAGQVDPAGMAFGRGGAWGTNLYFAEENAVGCFGQVFRREADGSATPIATGFPRPDGGTGIGNQNRLVFGRGDAFGTDLYVSDFPNGDPGSSGFGNGQTGLIYKVSPDGTKTRFAVGPMVDPYGLVFPPAGSVAWGSDLYVADYGDFDGTGYVWKVNSTGAVTLVAGGATSPFISPNDLAFGPGGAFGTDLYVRDFQAGQILKVTPAGVITTFATGLSGALPGFTVQSVMAMHGGMAFSPDGACLYVVDGSEVVRICGGTNAVGPDSDGDGIPDAVDDCPLVAGVCPVVPPVDLCPNPSLSLVSRWSAEGNAFDSAGSSNGKLVGATFAPGAIGQAFSFDGTNSVNIADASALTPATGLTVSLWFKPVNTGGPQGQYLVNKGDWAFGRSYFVALYPGGELIYGISTPVDDNPQIHVTVGAPLYDGQFHHLGATYDGAMMRLYLDGVQIGSQAATGVIHARAEDLLLGISSFRNVLNPFGLYTGLIDEVAIYNRGLCASDIAALAAGATTPVVVPAIEACTGDTVLLDDNFNLEGPAGGDTRNYSTFANWDISSGTVDLIGDGFSDFFPNAGLHRYIDTDGSTSNAGRMSSKSTFILSPGTYELQFDLAGSQRTYAGIQNTIIVSLGNAYEERFTLGYADPFRTITRSITITTPTSRQLVFEAIGGDNEGLLLDNIKFTRVCDTPPTDVGIEKNASTTSVRVGAELTFFVNVRNFGPGPATQVVFNDGMPANFQVVSVTTDRGICSGVGSSTANCVVGSMAAPSPAIDVVHIVIVAKALAPGLVDNTATVTHGEPDPFPGNDSATSEKINIEPAFAGISVDKIGRVLSDGRLEFTITILNLKTSPALNVKAQDTLQPDMRLVSVRSDDPAATCPADPLPTQNVQFVQCVLPTLAGSTAWQIIIIAEVMQPGPVVNTATGTADDLDPGDGIPTKTIIVDGGPGPRLIKSLEGAFYTGGIGTYRFTVSAPFGPVAGPIWVTDHLPTGLTFVSSTTTGGFVCTALSQDVTCKRAVGLSAGETATILLQVNVNVPAGQDVVNQGIILWPAGSGLSNPLPTGVGAPPLTIHKTVAPPEFGRLVYTIDAVNTGPFAVDHVTITDDLPITVRFVSATPSALCYGPDPVVCDLGTLQPGQAAQAIITVEYLVAGLIANSATLTGDGVPSVDDTVLVEAPGTDLKAEKEVSTPEVSVGDELRYTLRVRNLGPRVAQYAQIIDPIPAGLQVTSIVPDSGMICNNPPVPFVIPNNGSFRLICSTQNLVVNAFKAVVITVRTLITGPLENTITVDGGPGAIDPNPGNDGTGVTTTVVGVTLGDRVWSDADQDGVQDLGEAGLAGVVVDLLDTNGTVLGSTTTGFDGSYSFNVLANTTYGVRVAPLNFSASGGLHDFSVTTPEGNEQARSIVTTSVDTADFGYFRPVTAILGDRVWNDANGNGVQDPGEGGIAGVVIELLGISGNVIGTTTTGVDGSYHFVVAPGTYTVRAAPGNFLPGAPLAGQWWGTFPAGGSNSQSVTVTSQGNTTADFGYLAYTVPANGQFVIGDLTPHAIGQNVNFWGAQWQSNNVLSGGVGSNSFKGFNDVAGLPPCGMTWVSNPGTTSRPPASVSPFMAIIVSSKITKVGSNISGDVVQIVLIRTDAGYGSNPGQSGTGTVVATLCGGS